MLRVGLGESLGSRNLATFAWYSGTDATARSTITAALPLGDQLLVFGRSLARASRAFVK